MKSGVWRNGSAPDFGSGGSRFESLHARCLFFYSLIFVNILKLAWNKLLNLKKF